MKFSNASSPADYGFRIMVESMIEGALTLTPQGRIVYANPAFAAMVGYSPDQVVGTAVQGYFTAEQVGALEAMLRGEAPEKRQAVLLGRGGAHIPVKLSLSALPGAAAASLCLILTDLREQFRAEAVVRQSEKMAAVGQLAAGVVHELNNPLSAIIGFAQSLARHGQAPRDELLPIYETMEREALRCKTLVQQLLAFSGQRRTEMDVQDLTPLVETSLALVEPQTRMRRVELRRRFQAPIPPVRAAADQIQQIVINLCTNALDAMPQGGTLSVQLSSDGREVELRVIDTGTGIARDIQDRIFEPFFTTKSPGKGTGLGLSLVFEIVKSHGGRVEVDSEAGKGATFRVVLPAAARAAQTATENVKKESKK